MIGGRYGSADPPVLLARVAAPATEGRANRALLEALAKAFGVRPQRVKLVSGRSSRTKLVDIEGADPALAARLLEGGPAPGG